MAYVKYKDYAKRTESDKVLREKSFKIAKNSKCDGYQRGLASTVYEFLIKKYLQVMVLLHLQINLLLNLRQINNL